MKPSAHVQYRSCFRVKCTPDKTLGHVRRIVFEWLRRKEPDAIKAETYESFKKRLDMSSMLRTRSRLSTDYCFRPGDISWAMRYEHRDAQYAAKRFWYTDVGLRIHGEELIISTTISFAFNENDISGDLPTPPANVPNFIREILADESLGKKYVRRPGDVLQAEPLVFKKDALAQAIPKLLQTGERTYAWLIVSGEDELADSTARDFAYGLAGKCQVIHLKETAADLFEREVPFECQVRRGFIRVFFPTPTGILEPSRQRWFAYGTEEFAAQRHNIINGLLRNLPAYEPMAVWSIEDVRTLLRLEMLAKQTAELGNLSGKDAAAKFKQIVSRNLELEQDIRQARAQAEEQRSLADAMAADVDMLEQDLGNQRAKTNQLQHALRLAEAKGGTQAGQFKLPETLAELCVLHGNLYGDRIVYLPQAMKEARAYDGFKHLEKAWDMLNSMAFALHEMRFVLKGGMDGEWNKRFQERTGYELAISEGKQTKADPALMRLRKVVHEGKTYDIEPHIKWGNQSPKMLRVHYAFDEELQKVIIGYVGPHMRNYTSKQM